MKRPVVPFSVPRTIDQDLTRVRAYWESLKRGDSNMPFWDDFKISSLPDLTEKLILIDVFKKPERFRLNSIGQQLTGRYGETIAGRFIDELEPKNPLEYLPSQCSATVESRAPTYYQHGAGTVQESQGAVSYSRLLLPMWGNGYIGMLLGAFEWR
jgi:hypothetical protein